MDIYIIREKIKNKEYEAKVPYPTTRKFKEGHIFDEDKSVKWNKEEVERKNAEIDAEINAYRESSAQGAKDFEDDVIAYLLADYKLNNNRKIAEKIYAKAYEEGHSSGHDEVLNYAIDIASFVEDILEM